MWLFLCILAALSWSRAANAVALFDTRASMASVDFSKLNIVKKPLHVPPLDEIVDVLARGLKNYFADVLVSTVPCPDLTQAPYESTSPGLSGEVSLVELGGPPYLLPLVQRDKVYDLGALLRHLRRDPGFMAGAGAGPWPHFGVNCEGIINLSVSSGAVRQGSRAVEVHPRGAAKGASGYLQTALPQNETRTALLGNYLLSRGEPGTVIEVIAKNRTGADNFITAIRETLTKHYGDKVVGLGGVFVLEQGSAKHHVMPGFSEAPLCSDEAVDNWLHYFTYPAPLVHYGTLVTGDMGLDLRPQHFHGWGAGCGGHYHGDTTPAQAQYRAYFVPAQSLIRVDQPPQSQNFGKD